MEPNPYQSPVIPPANRQQNDGPDGALRLLTEIRDNQQEMLSIYRRTAATSRFVFIAILVVGVLAITATVVVASVRLFLY